MTLRVIFMDGDERLIRNVAEWEAAVDYIQWRKKGRVSFDYRNSPIFGVQARPDNPTYTNGVPT